ncbi:hypothetical protein, partial [Streptomyces sp. NPDC002922]|uniref:EF-Tu C-terminal domain-related protein n=1 Tax=Streptomyces sp. NPDC002922 TaxID=3154439 RepID=UPI0033BF3950
GGRHTPFFNNYRPQFYFRTTDVTGVVTLPEDGSPAHHAPRRAADAMSRCAATCELDPRLVRCPARTRTNRSVTV